MEWRSEEGSMTVISGLAKIQALASSKDGLLEAFWRVNALFLAA
jgi:hypothetical protein